MPDNSQGGRKKKNKWQWGINDKEINNKMSDLSLYISKITLEVSCLKHTS